MISPGHIREVRVTGQKWGKFRQNLGFQVDFINIRQSSLGESQMGVVGFGALTPKASSTRILLDVSP